MTREEAIEKIINGFCKLRVWCELYPDDCQKEDCEMWWAIESLKAKMDGDMGEVSDGYHTFNQLYHQRAVLFATIVKQNKEKAWKSWKHGDGKFCFDSNKEWFIVGVDTPKGSYTYHYEKKYWDMFDCIELEHGKFWDGHTEDDVTRLLSLPPADRPTEWIPCSERMPDAEYGEGDSVLCCTELGLMYTLYWNGGNWCVTTGEPHQWVNHKTGWHDKVIAWMPLPTPYKGGEEE